LDNYSDFVISFSHVNQIIADMYDPEKPLSRRVDQFFVDLSRVILFDRANILFYRKINDRYEMHSIFTYNWTLAEEIEYQAKYCYQDDVLGLLDYDHDIAFITDQTFNSSVREKSSYFQGFLLPMGQHSSIESNFTLRAQNLRGIFSIHRGKDKQPFTDSDLRLIRMFQPHMPRIFHSYGLQENKTPDPLHFDTLTLGSFGVCAFDQNLNMISCNDVYRQFASENLMDSLVSKRLKALCRRLRNTGQATIEYKVKETPYLLEVRAETSSDSGLSSYFLCFCYDMGRMLRICISQLCKENALSERESEVLMLAVQGQSNEEIGDSLSISVSTVKKHLVSVYDKLGVSNLKQILLLLHFYGNETPV